MSKRFGASKHFEVVFEDRAGHCSVTISTTSKAHPVVIEQYTFDTEQDARTRLGEMGYLFGQQYE